MRFLLYGALSAILLAACGDPIDDHIDNLMEGGETREQAFMDLLFARSYAVPPLLSALADADLPPRGRADVATVLWKIYLRDSDERIIGPLLDRLDDPEARVRRAVAWGLREMGNPDLIPEILDRLEAETNQETQFELLRAMEALDGWDVAWEQSAGNFAVRGGSNLTPEDRERFARITRDVYAEATHDSLLQQASEFLERFAVVYVMEAQQLILKADISGAELSLLQALDLKPDSIGLLLRLGKLYYLNGQEQKGLDLLEKHGLLLRIPHLSRAPAIDGDLSDPVWSEACKIDQFHKSATLMRPIPTDSRTEALIGYRDNQIYFGVVNYDETTQGLSIEYRAHDSAVWRDDCIEIFFDTNMDQRSFYQFVTNAAGATFDLQKDGPTRDDAPGWDGEMEVAARIEPTYWTLEKAIAVQSLDGVEIQPGDVWGFNLVRARIGLAAEHCQWLPTYGFTHRPDYFGMLIFD